MLKFVTKTSISDLVAAFSSLDAAFKRAALAKLKKLMPFDSFTVDQFVETPCGTRDSARGFACTYCNSDMVIRHEYGSPLTIASVMFKILI